MIDVIIATYNRFDRALALANSLLLCGGALIQKVILVDSTDNQKVYKEGDNSKIVHILTSHKNQPMQRYIGYQQATAEVLLFLDDDMEIANDECIAIINKCFQNKEISALAINFKDKHEDTSLAMIPKTVISQKVTGLKKAINWFTAYPYLPPGVFGFCGVRGPQPIEGGSTTFVSGGAFAARRSCLYQNFNFLLFDLYDKKLGKGEDAITGYTLSKQGKVVYNNTLLFYHNDQKDSAYSVDHYSYARRVACSRMYLSLEKARLDGSSMAFAKLHYHWYTGWRTLGLLINYMIERTESRKKLLQGTLNGWRVASTLSFSYKPEPISIKEHSK